MAIKCAVCYVLAEGDTCPGCGAPQPVLVAAPTAEPASAPAHEPSELPLTPPMFEAEAIVPDQRLLPEPTADDQTSEVAPAEVASPDESKPRKKWRFPYEIRRRTDSDSSPPAGSG